MSDVTEEASKKKDAEPAEPAAPAGSDAFDKVRSSWGFPSFAKTFPRHPELDDLVGAFARGDYMAIRERAPRLATSSDASDEVKRAAEVLRARIEPDPTSRVLFLVAVALLVFLTTWWVMHDGPELGSKPKTPPPPPKVEHVD